MIRGSCLCQAVQYQIDGPMGTISHCHCSMCRKAHGAAFGSYARVQWRDFRWLSGEEEVTYYRSSPTARRSFCRHCGATLQWLRDDRKDFFALAVGTLDDDPGVGADCHIHVADQAPWYRIGEDGLARHPGDDE